MSLLPSQHETLDAFVNETDFMKSGCVMTDLDGTAVHEHAGRVYIPDEVARGMRSIRQLGRPVILNSLRFPLSVIRTFGREWYEISNAALPVVALNGSLIGHLEQDERSDIVFREDAAWSLDRDELLEVLRSIEGLLADGIDEIVLFHYPRDWTQGEHVWTPSEARVAGLRSRYASASAVSACSVADLERALLQDEHVMLMLLADIPQDKRMAYQHTSPTSVFTHRNTDKSSGAREITHRLGLDLSCSIGAGDTPMDTFLDAVGLAVHIGPLDLAFRGRYGTLYLDGSHALGDMLFDLAGRIEAANDAKG